MLIREILSSVEPFPTIQTDDTIRRAAELMRDRDVRAVAVVENDRLLGILTDWDIVDAFASKSGELGDLPASAVMTSKGLITIEAGATAADASARLAEHRVHHLPVLDGERYVGMICLGIEWSEEDLLTPPVRPTLTARRP